MQRIYIPTIIILLASCSTNIRYIGKSLPPTHDVEVYISEQSIHRPFEYIGKGYVGGIGFHKPNIIQKKAEKLGREKGADAVLIVDYYIPNTGGSSISSIYRTDSIGKGTVTTGNSTINPTDASGYHIVYLKYKK